jgi:hypothetical protein
MIYRYFLLLLILLLYPMPKLTAHRSGAPFDLSVCPYDEFAPTMRLRRAPKQPKGLRFGTDCLDLCGFAEISPPRSRRAALHWEGRPNVNGPPFIYGYLLLVLVNLLIYAYPVITDG